MSLLGESRRGGYCSSAVRGRTPCFPDAACPDPGNLQGLARTVSILKMRLGPIFFLDERPHLVEHGVHLVVLDDMDIAVGEWCQRIERYVERPRRWISSRR